MPIPARFLAPWLALPRSLHIIFFAQITNRMGDFAIPLLTLFLTRKLGLDSSLTGLLVMAAALSALTGNVISGRLSDHFGRKPVLIICQTAAALLIASCGFIPPGLAIPPLLIIAGFFQGAVRPSISAMIIDLSTPDNRKLAFSLSYLGINIGVAIGPIFVGFLFEEHLPWIFWIDALSTLLAVSLVALLIPETHPVHGLKQPAAPGEAVQEGSALRAFFSRPELVIFCLVLLVNNFMYAQTQFGLALWNNQVFGAEGARWYGWLMSCNAVTVLVLTMPLTWLTRKLPVLLGVGLGSLCYVIGFGMMAFSLPPVLLLVSTVIWTMGEILFAINVGTWFASRTPQNLRGRFQSIQGLMINTGIILSPLVCGQVIRNTGIFGSWALVAVLGLPCALAAVWLHQHFDRVKSR